MKKLAALLLLMSIAVAAQQLPDAPSKLIDKEAIAGLAPMYVAIVADDITTRHALDSGNCVESSPLYGPHPSVKKQVIISSAEAVGMTVVSLLFKRMLRKYSEKHLWLIFPTITAGAHGIAAYSNSQNRCY